MPEIRSSSANCCSRASLCSSWSCRGQLLVDLLFLREHALLDLDDPAAVLCNLPVDLSTQLDRFLANGDLRLPP